MAEAKEAKFQWGQRVTAADNLVNDGSFPDVPMDTLLVPLGSSGEIVNVGLIEETGDPVYLVEFTNGKVIGVFEEEITAE